MSDINPYIEEAEVQQTIIDFLAIKRKIPNICDTLSKLSQIDDKYFKKQLNKQKTLENSVKSGKNDTCSLTDTTSLNTMKESFHLDLDDIRNNYLDIFDELNACDKALIYKYTEFIKKFRSNNN